MITKLKDNNGIVKYGRKEISKIATEFYRNLFASKELLSWEQWKDTIINKDPIPLILGEGGRAVKEAKLNKTPGPDGIDNELIKILTEAITKPLPRACNRILKTGVTPAQWRKSEIILLHKKGDRADIRNYQPISLSSNIQKLFMKILKNRILETLDFHQPMEHTGFRNYN